MAQGATGKTTNSRKQVINSMNYKSNHAKYVLQKPYTKRIYRSSSIRARYFNLR